jgi:hypothetical protein
MKLYFRSSGDDLQDVIATGRFPERDGWTGRGVSPSADRPVSIPEPVVAVIVPDDVAGSFARSSEWSTDYVIPASIVERHDPRPDLSFA